MAKHRTTARTCWHARRTSGQPHRLTCRCSGVRNFLRHVRESRLQREGNLQLVTRAAGAEGAVSAAAARPQHQLELAKRWQRHALLTMPRRDRRRPPGGATGKSQGQGHRQLCGDYGAPAQRSARGCVASEAWNSLEDFLPLRPSASSVHTRVRAGPACSAQLLQSRRSGRALGAMIVP